jgi:hypothetical protein
MSEDSKLPSTRQILESDAAESSNDIEPGRLSQDLPDDEDFRRVITALRIVLRMRS